MTAPAIIAAREAGLALRLARDAIAADRRRHREILREADTAEAELNELQEAEATDAALRALDGDAAAPPSAAREKRVRELRKEIPAKRGAADVLMKRISVAEAAIDPAPFAGAVLGVAVDILGDAEAEIREILGKLAEPLARIIAATDLVESQLGGRFAVPPGAQVPSIGAPAAKALMKAVAALPERFRSVDLVERVVRESAARTLNSVLKDIKNG